MRISVKGRYALASVISMAEQYEHDEPVTVVSISERLGISKIYLEQVFSLLKRGGVVSSTKGSQGGYKLARLPHQITALEILSAVEQTLFEPVEDTVQACAPAIEKTMRLTAFDQLDQAIRTTLGHVTLSHLLNELERQKSGQELMYYI
jgi:Rrf2 family protein